MRSLSVLSLIVLLSAAIFAAEGSPIATAAQNGDRKAVRALLASYHRIDDAGTSDGLAIEAESALDWMRSASGDDIAANRDAVFERGRAQVR